MIFQKSNCEVPDFLHLAEGFLKRWEEMDFELFIATARGIWFKRNMWLYEGRFSHPNEVVQ